MSDGKTTSNQELNLQRDGGLRSYSAFAKCSCGATGYTKVEHKCNVLNLIFCCCLTECWYCYQIHKKKDLNCYDAEHKCATCNGKDALAHYTAC